MSYSIELIRQEEQPTTNWSGGTTTQIAIYPKQAVYAERNFAWRISSARVDLEESVFTSLPGIWRLIMVLEGEMRLEHTGHHSTCLKPFEQDSFSGDWITKSYGKVRDFNLMLGKSANGKLTVITLAKTAAHQTSIHLPDNSPLTSAFYCIDGASSVTVPHGETYKLTGGDMLLITTDQAEDVSVTLLNTAGHETHIVRADIQYL